MVILTLMYTDGCRATLHDTIGELFEEKYPDINEEMKSSKYYEAMMSDPNREMKIFAKVWFHGTSASVLMNCPPI
jgi:hypothetical protein